MTPKRIFVSALLLLLLAGNAPAAVYYVDYAAGNDTTGDGTYGTPWATIDKCTTDGATTGGDECRVAKHTPTALSGTLTFTNGSTSVATSADLTGELSAGDFVGLNATDESWWIISSLDSSTITLTYQYWGPGTGSASTGYKAALTSFTASIDINNSGTSSSNRLKISGGWDLSTQTQDGWTFLRMTGSAYFLKSNSNTYFEYSKFVMLAPTSTTYSDLNGSTAGSYYKDIIWVGNRFAPISGTPDDYNVYENILQSGGTENGLHFISDRFEKIVNFISYSAGSGAGDYGVSCLTTASVIIDGLKIYNAYASCVNISQSFNMSFKDVIIDTNRYSNTSDGVNISSSIGLFFKNVSINNVTDDGFQTQDYLNIAVNGLTLTNIASDIIYPVTSISNAITCPGVFVSSYGGTPGDDRIYFGSGSGTVSYIQRDTADARSGSCLKFFPADNLEGMNYKIGTAKVTDGGSDMTLYVYLKDDASFNGSVGLYAMVNGAAYDVPEIKTMTTDYAENSITVPAAAISTDDWVDLYIFVNGTAGSVYVDDFASSN